MSEQRCGCCAGVEALTPLPTANRPGLDALGYRVGTYTTFLETMVAPLSGHRLGDGRRPLHRLSTRDPADPSLALLDAWACVATVLTFYQERIANEGYLRTATERRSVLELARLVGYRPRPGVAASVYLAFTLEQGYQIEVPVGTRAQSIPGPGALPQFFETAEPLPARTEWNAIPARQTRPTFLASAATVPGTHTFYAHGAVTNLKPNDTVLIVCGNLPQPYTVQTVEPDASAEHTLVAVTPFNAGFSAPRNNGTTIAATANGATRGSPLTRLGSVVEALKKEPSLPPPSRFELPRSPDQTYSDAADLGPQLLTQFNPGLKDTLYTAYANAPVNEVNPRTQCHVEAMRVKAAPFGHNAPQELVLRDNVPVERREWMLSEFGGTARVLITSTATGQSVVAAFAGSYDLLENVNPLTIEVAFADDQGVIDSATLNIRDLIDPNQPPFGEDNPVFRATRTLDQDKVVDIEVAYEGSFSNGRYDDTRLGHIRLAFRTHPEYDTTMRIYLFEPVIGAAGAAQSLHVAIDNDTERQIAINDPPIEDTIGDRAVTISLNGGLAVAHRTPDLPMKDQLRTLSLDATYDKITPGSYVVVDRGEADSVVTQVRQVRTVSRADYGISARVTQLVLGAPWLTPGDRSLAVLRGTTVYAQSERMELAEEPIEDDVVGDEIELDRLYDGVAAGRWLVVQGTRTDVLAVDGQPVDGVQASELVMLAGVVQDVHKIPDENGEGNDIPMLSRTRRNGTGRNGTADNGTEIELPTDTLHTRLTLSAPLAFTYRRDTVRINANVVRATHGETRNEVLGSGAASTAFQQFTLKQAPLTHVAAPTPTGVESTLEVRVNDVRWPEQETLLFLGGHQRGYQTTADDDNRTTVVFGDGTHGTRLPTGVENVTAVYRSGIGKSGNVAASQISSLATRPLGVKEVINPQRASGGADPESRDQARRNVPLAVLALDRLVSVQDYTDFTRTFAGIGKAHAASLSDGRREIVHLSIAGVDDAPIDQGSDLQRNLLLALHRFGNPNLPLQVAVREVVLIVLSARVRVLTDYRWDTVEPKARTALLDIFGFERRELGQDVLLSEAISTIQAVEGVDYVDVDLLDGISETDARDPETLAAKLEALATAQPRRRLTVDLARIDPGTTDPALRIRPAQLAYLNPDLPDTLILTDVTS